MTITPDIAAKLLNADLHNIVKKVSDGGVLTTGERSMLQNCAVPGGEVKARRAAVLLTKYAAGSRLTGAELIEIQEVYPAFAAADVLAPVPSGEESGSSFALQSPDVSGPRIVGTRVRYPEPLSVYAKRFGTDERTLKRYVARGREIDPPDLPPFHQPSDLKAWCERRMPNRCPQWVLDAAARYAIAPLEHPQPVERKPVERNAPVDSLAPPIDSAPETDPLPGRDFSDVEILSLDQNVQELRRSTAIALRLLNEAQRGIDEALITSRQRIYAATFDLLRKAENDLIAWQKDREILVPRDDVRKENNRIASTVVQAVLRLVKRTRPQLAGKTESEQDSIWTKETSACFSALKNAKFTSFENAGNFSS